MLAAALPAALETVAWAASEQPTDYLGELVKAGISPGAALVASRHGSLKLQQAVGTCCRLNQRAARLTLETQHPLYSFSKLITGTVVAIARTEGRLDYGDRVSKYIPEFAGGGKDGGERPDRARVEAARAGDEREVRPGGRLHVDAPGRRR